MCHEISIEDPVVPTVYSTEQSAAVEVEYPGLSLSVARGHTGLRNAGQVQMRQSVASAN